MKAKEKAKLLLECYCERIYGQPVSKTGDLRIPKSCAIVAIELIIEATDYIPCDDERTVDTYQDYWKEVKKEITLIRSN